MGNGSSFTRFTPPPVQALRTRCDACGAGNLVWGTLAQIGAQLDAEGQLRASEALAYFAADDDAYRCPGCGNFGIFSKWQTGF